MELPALIQHAKNAITNAYINRSKLPVEVLNVQGMSGNKTRHLYNNMCALKDMTYVEVGTWKGSSFIGAMFGNKETYGICIDNWSEFGGPKTECIANINHHLSLNTNITVIDKDCWSITEADLLNKPIDIFMYDGQHTYETQKKAITYYCKFFSKYVIIMVDDWTCDWVDVKKGTMDGIAEMKLKIHYSCEIPLVNTTVHHQGGDTFWNGCGVFVCERTDL